MLVTERVRLVRPLESGGMGSVWVAQHETLGTEVAVKFVRVAGDERMRRRLSREAQLGAKIDHPHAVRVFDHGRTPAGAPFIVMELLDGETLSDRIEREGPLGVADVRRLVSQVAEVLSEAHRQGIAHRDIKPHNIVLLSATDSLFAKVLDFGIAKPFVEAPDAITLTAEGEVVGTPVYMAPEQLIDGRPAAALSDLWGLSVVAYEALTGHRPFRGRTRAAIGAFMLLQRYERVCSERPELPAALDEWFGKTLAVEPENRFDTAKKLAAAFVEASSGAAGPAPVSAGERRLHLSDVLYGRDAELATLREAFARVADGQSRVVLIAGYSGIGKTSLVAEVRPSLAGRGATFVGGKFDQFDRGTPYHSLVQAFREMTRWILAGENAAAWRARIVEGVRENLRALTDVIPELERLIGSQPELDPVSPGEARNRFQTAIGRFVRSIASAEHPLVVFLDDLQWADLPSIQLIAKLSSDPESRHVLIIGAYRDNEVGDGHPLDAAIARMREDDGPLDTIALGPLGEDAVLDLVSDATDRAPGRVRLSLECHEKTRGNAFFLKRFLESLNETRLLRFDPDRSQWTWDLSAIQALPMTENVVDFVADEIRRMPEGVKTELGVASCIGNSFDLATLAFALGSERGAALKGLREALEAELVVPQSESTWLTGPNEQSAGRLTFRFAHDRIRQAARTLVDDDSAARVHRSVGRYMLERLDPAEQEQRLFELVEHLNRGTPEDLVSTGSIRLRDLNLAAARRASASAAFEPADGYYRAARANLSPEAWTSDHELTHAIYVEGARAAYLSGDHETMTRLVETAIEMSRGALERVSAQEVMIQAFASQQRLHEALRLALTVLGELGVEVPFEPTGEEIQAAVAGTLAMIEEAGPDAIVALSACEDAMASTVARVEKSAMSSAYLAMPNLLPILAGHIVRSTLSDGVYKESPYGFAVFGLVLNAINMIDTSQTVGDIALGLLDRIDDRSVRPSTMHIIAGFLEPWIAPIRRSLEHERQAYELALDTGDLEYASWALHLSVCNSFYAGIDLAVYAETYDRYHAVLVHHQQLPALACTVPYGQVIENLVGRAPDPSRLVGPDYDEDEHIAAMKAIGLSGAAYIAAALGTFVRFLFRDLEAAVERANAVGDLAGGVTATYHPVYWHQYRALSILGRLAAGSEELPAARADIEASLAQLNVWSGFSEVNHGHRVHLIAGEIARIEGREEEASDLYDQAIRGAVTGRFLHEEAIGQELAARFHLERGDQAAARTYVREAVASYGRWGASAKTSQLGTEFEKLLADSPT